MNPEQPIYQAIYDSWIPGRYGSSNHGYQHLDKILKLTPKSLLDVGCGYNQFWTGPPMCKCECDIHLECEPPLVYNTTTCKCEPPLDVHPQFTTQ